MLFFNFFVKFLRVIRREVEINIEEGDLGGSMKRTSEEGGGFLDYFNRILSSYSGLISGVLGVATLTVIVVFIFQCLNFANSGGNPMQRQKAVSGLVICSISIAILGGLFVFVTIFYNVLR